MLVRYHYKCLDAHMTVPPFEKACLTCEERLYHPRWPSDVRKLERQWAFVQASLRELDDVADFLG